MMIGGDMYLSICYWFPHIILMTLCCSSQVHDAKKNYYKKFLYEPFPVESSLLPVLPDHFNAEGTNTQFSKQEAI